MTVVDACRPIVCSLFEGQKKMDSIAGHAAWAVCRAMDGLHDNIGPEARRSPNADHFPTCQAREPHVRCSPNGTWTTRLVPAPPLSSKRLATTVPSHPQENLPQVTAPPPPITSQETRETKQKSEHEGM